MTGFITLLWRRTPHLLPLVLILLGVALLVGMMIWTAPGARGVTVTGDWTIGTGETQSLSNDTWELEGDLLVEGTLKLDNATLRFTTPDRNLTVRATGSMETRDSQVETPTGKAFNLTVEGELDTDHSTLKGFFGTVYVQPGATLTMKDSTLNGEATYMGNDTMVGVKADRAASLVLDRVTFVHIRSIALVTIGEPGTVTAPDYSQLIPGVAHRRHSHYGQFQLNPGSGVNLTDSVLGVLDGQGSPLTTWRWESGVMGHEVLAWTEDDEGVVKSFDPFTLTARWDLLSQRQGQLCECDFAWGEMLWAKALDWPAEGPSGIETYTPTSPSLNLSLGNATLVTTHPEQWEPLSVQVTLNNPDPVRIHRIKVHLLLGLEPVSVKLLEDLPPASQTTFLVNWSQVFQSGSFKLELVLDPDQDLNQWTERHNDRLEVQVEIAGSKSSSEGGSLWIVALVLLFLIGLVGYVIFSNLQVETEDSPEPASALSGTGEGAVPQERSAPEGPRDLHGSNGSSEPEGSGQSEEAPDEPTV